MKLETYRKKIWPKVKWSVLGFGGLFIVILIVVLIFNPDASKGVGAGIFFLLIGIPMLLFWFLTPDELKHYLSFEDVVKEREEETKELVEEFAEIMQQENHPIKEIAEGLFHGAILERAKQKDELHLVQHEIDRRDIEIERLKAEVERLKTDPDSAKIMAETRKIIAEAEKIQQEAKKAGAEAELAEADKDFSIAELRDSKKDK